MIVLFLTLLICRFNITYGMGNIVNELKINASEYTVRFTSERALISRDGGEAIEITSGTTLTKPGTYFLTLFDNKKRIKVSTFTILATKDSSSWTIKRESELDEILKYAIENFKKEITIKFNYGEFSIDELSDIIDKRINTALDKYPKLVYEGYTISSTLGNKPIVKLKIEYPLKVINTLKAYDARMNKLLIQIINQNISAEMEDYEREAALFKYVVDHMTYSKTKDKGIEYINATPMSHTMYGGLIDKTAVCDGYAKSLMYLLNAVGIPARFIVGNIKEDGVLHAWNLVQIQGAYYHVDSTWGDQDNDKIGGIYEFFNEKDSYMKNTHWWDEKIYPKAVTETYSSIFIPIKWPNVYRIMKRSDVTTVFADLAKNSPKTATLILYQDLVNHWNQEEIVNRIAASVKQDVIYMSERKYDALIISFKID
jgi:transglutaminase-like putative cysteine protease